MRVAIVHYHLKPGGVTRVIENAVASLEALGVETVVLAGEPYSGNQPLKVAVVPELRYTGPQEKSDASLLAKAMQEAASAVLGGEVDLWHIHNHSLGKNSAIIDVVNAFAEQGRPLLLQMHDFAEDGRPSNYQYLSGLLGKPDSIYPKASNVHYAVLNGRDFALLQKAGFDAESIHLLPNPIAVPQLGEADSASLLNALSAERLFIYPTRSIRRKNLGEFLLWSALAEPGDVFANTLSPANPAVRPFYDPWVDFAESLKLPMRFAIGEQPGVSFDQIMSAASAIVTTSVAEGFGLAFLEPWLFDKPLLGRNLPEITSDFVAEGVDLGPLYNTLPVPREFLDETALTTALSEAFEGYYAAYEQSIPESAVERCLGSMTEGDSIDFGRLREDFQRTVIEQYVNSSDSQEGIKAHFSLTASQHVDRGKNRQMIEATYNLQRYGESLRGLYEQTLAAPKEPIAYFDSKAVLDCFLEPERFSFLRS